MTIRCGTGTYIRTLGIDLAKLCETTAVMTRLVRTAIGAFSLAGAIELEQLSAASLDAHLQPLAKGVSHLPQLELADARTGIAQRPERHQGCHDERHRR